ncbi:MAG: GGDEF domain-containing protein [Solirubrobacterales bacterium]
MRQVRTDTTLAKLRSVARRDDAVPAPAAGASRVTSSRRSPPRWVDAAMLWSALLAVGAGVVTMMVAPIAVPALTIVLFLPVLAAAFFFRTRDFVIVGAAATIAAIAPLIHDFGAASADGTIPRLAVWAPLIWLIGGAVHLQRRERDRAISDAAHQAFTDPLTGIGNLRALRDHAERAFAGDAGKHHVTALVLLDLDNFKEANSRYGQAGGDEILRAVGAALVRAASANHHVARISGDRFAVLMHGVARCDVKDMAIRYRLAVQRARPERRMPEITLDASVGFAYAPEHGGDLDALLTVADQALDARGDGRGAVNVHGAEIAGFLPGEFGAPEPVWITAREPEPAETGRSNWRNRPSHALLASGAWLLGTTLMLLSLALPGADRTYIVYALPWIGAGMLPVVANYFFAPDIGGARHLLSDVYALIWIAITIFLTGGAESPAWPLVMLFIAYEGWFLTGRELSLRLFGAVIVVASIPLYEDFSAVAEPAAAVVALICGAGVSAILTVAMAYNRRDLDLARDVTGALATFDPLTGMANRRAFDARLAADLEQVPYNMHDQLGVVVLELDDFAAVNKLHGHQAGDALLCEIAIELEKTVRETDLIARVGGDEFAVVLAGVGSDGARILAERLVDAVAGCADRSELEAVRRVTASAGFALYPVNGHSTDKLVNAACLALMTVKSGGAGRSRVSRLMVQL